MENNEKSIVSITQPNDQVKTGMVQRSGNFGYVLSGYLAHNLNQKNEGMHYQMRCLNNLFLTNLTTTTMQGLILYHWIKIL